MNLNIEDLSLSITASDEEIKFYNFVKEKGLNWNIGDVFTLGDLKEKHVIVGADKFSSNDNMLIICQKYSRKIKKYNRRFQEGKERKLIPAQIIRIAGKFYDK